MNSYYHQLSRTVIPSYGRYCKRFALITVSIMLLIYVLNVQQEKQRQKHFINLIPSENFTSKAVLDALGSVMQSVSDWPHSHCLC